jgi:hypothetical protein
MAQQTAVEFYEQALRKGLMGTVEWDPNQTLEQANQMFQEQIMKAFSDGQETPINNPTLPHYSREEYYNERYGK